METKYKLVLLRHGQSTWNLENRFTGWTDVGLTEQGMGEAHTAGQLLRDNKYTFDLAYTSVLKRAIQTLWIVLEEMSLEWIPVVNAWQLNERHYGALQGLNKAETAKEYGEAQVKIWRRSYDVPPPALEWDDPRHPHFDPRYAGLEQSTITGYRVSENHFGACFAILAYHHCTCHQDGEALVDCRAWQQPAGHGQIPG